MVKYLWSSKCTTRHYTAVGIPQVYWYGTEAKHNVMALELLGENLEGVFKVSGKKLSLKCVVLLGMQMVTHRLMR